MRRPRRLVLSAAALGLALAASGCTYLSPVQTHDFYQAADGTNANLQESGTLFAGVRNAIFVVGEEGTSSFSATVVNYTDAELTVELEAIADGSAIFATSASVPAGETVELGPEEGQQSVPLGDAPVEPGHMIDLEVSSDGQSTVITVPVVETSLSHFEEPEPSDG